MIRKKDKVELDFTPKTNEKYLSVTSGCIRFIDSFRFLSGSLNSLVKTFVENNHKTLNILKKEFVGDNNILNFGCEIETLLRKGRYNNESIEDLKKDFPDENQKNWNKL